MGGARASPRWTVRSGGERGWTRVCAGAKLRPGAGADLRGVAKTWSPLARRNTRGVRRLSRPSRGSVDARHPTVSACRAHDDVRRTDQELVEPTLAPRGPTATSVRLALAVPCTGARGALLPALRTGAHRARPSRRISPPCGARLADGGCPNIHCSPDTALVAVAIIILWRIDLVISRGGGVITSSGLDRTRLAATAVRTADFAALTFVTRTRSCGAPVRVFGSRTSHDGRENAELSPLPLARGWRRRADREKLGSARLSRTCERALSELIPRVKRPRVPQERRQSSRDARAASRRTSSTRWKARLHKARERRGASADRRLPH